MDSHYGLNGFPSSSDAPPQPHSYSTSHNSSSSSTIHRFPDHHMPPSSSNTLPPIGPGPAQSYHQHQHQPFFSHAGSMPHTPIAPQTPMQPTSSAPPHPNTYSHVPLPPPPPPPGPPRTLQPSPAHLPPVSSFSTTAPSTSMAQPAFYPTAAPLGVRSLSDLRPRPDGLIPHLATQPATLPKHSDYEPTHVVGQQGRRGILPSAPGRAPPSTGKSIVPVKDQDGKFPCPHCSKTYLHAKHLKRHMLRHTGDRPYQCKLCKDTFSRSDILKRHFQKCSIRRGAPPDGDHLEGARVHQNKNRLSVGSVNEQHYLNSLGTPGFDPNIANHIIGGGLGNFLPGHGLSSQPLPPEPSGYSENVSSISNRTSRSSSLMQPSSTMNETRQHFSRPGYEQAADYPSVSQLQVHGIPAYSMPTAVQSGGPLTSHPYGFGGQSTTAEMAATPPVTAANGSNGMFAGRSSLSNGHGHEMSWNGGYHTPANPGYPVFSGQVGGDHRTIKSEGGLLANGMPTPTHTTNGSAEDGDVFSNLYSNSFTFAPNHVFDGWDIGDPLVHKAGALVSFCFPTASSHPTEDQARLRTVLSADNLRQFIGLFCNFQGHWPVIHMPTFKPIDAYDGLLLAMAAIGAIYSNRLDLHTQRWFMELAQRSIQRSSRIYNGQPRNGYGTMAGTHSDIEEIQALVMLQVVFTWHGNEAQRASSRENFFRLTSIARQHGLLQPLPPTHPGFSVLHHERKSAVDEDRPSWNWSTWVEQEKRLRAMYLIYLLDIALVIYFNCQPQIEWQELRLQLPSDDAAWEARSAAECMEALGLMGPAVRDVRNATGSRRRKQPSFVASVKVLLHPSFNFQPGSTNVYSKFILIHALHVLIWSWHRQASSAVTAATYFGQLASGPSTPIGQNDWVNNDTASVGSISGTPSGRATPDVLSQHSAQLQRVTRQLMNAVEKWKAAWDLDMELQYPNSITPGGTELPRRAGFCRDGIHFYWLAKLLLNSNRVSDSQLPADTRFSYVMQMLKQVRTYVATEAYKEGKSIGSVAEIQEDYGVEDLTLDMKLLFTPL